jgi:hypothetical protein
MAGRSRFLRHYAPGLALAVWVPTVALGAWAWWSATQRGREPDDTRRAVRVTAEERAVVLEVMRANLVAIHAVLDAQASGDLHAVAVAARAAADTPGPAARLGSLKHKLPPEWREVGKQVDATFAAMSEQARLGNSAGVTRELANNTAACVSCHAMFRLTLEDAR